MIPESGPRNQLLRGFGDVVLEADDVPRAAVPVALVGEQVRGALPRNPFFLWPRNPIHWKAGPKIVSCAANVLTATKNMTQEFRN